MRKREEHPRVLATDLGPNPGEFPVGSLESRAAARSMLEAKEAIEAIGSPTFLVRFISPGVPVDDSKCTCKHPKPGTIGFCRCFSGRTC